MWKRLSVLMLIGLIELASAQRPSFAGARPPGGLSQKDKYNGAQNTAVENISGVDIATRFGSDAVPQQAQTVSLAYGAPQRPPVGVPLVFAVSSYEPVVASSVVPATVDVANRFGGGAAAASPPSVGSTQAPASGVSPPPSPTPSVVRPVANALPIDAHGDENYVNYLSQLPQDNQPFWFLNYQAIEALRNSSRPNVGALETRGSFFAG
ncbi:hypothetical protein AWZ03_009497 [Drosophila navojoa]|uniref:DUF4794 domain-containing protein n=1 Tax=Drosophila navojoa TaxID=7232 RepID=A0A484B6Z9_DRONA|nr:uncharacterized protein LOC108651565 [Drosophila navojoa]TDG44072.1 hypothetical protein AWZ03_009497 [Drosophila navojoa]